MHITKTIRALGALSAAAVLGGGFSLATAQDAPPTPQPASSTAPSPGPPDLEVFRSSQAPRVTDDQQVAKLKLRLGPLESAAPNVEQIRQVSSDKTGDVFLMSTDEKLCVLVRSSDGSGGSGCSPKAVDPARPPIMTDVVGGGRSRVTLLAPDGVTQMTVTTDGKSTSVPVVNSVATAVVSGDPTSIAWNGPAPGSVGSPKVTIDPKALAGS